MEPQRVTRATIAGLAAERAAETNEVRQGTCECGTMWHSATDLEVRCPYCGAVVQAAQ